LEKKEKVKNKEHRQKGKITATNKKNPETNKADLPAKKST